MGFQGTWLIHLGRRYGLFDCLAERDEVMMPKKLASMLNLAEEPVSLWCEAAHQFGLLIKRKNGYRIKSNYIPLLVDERDPRFIGGLPSYLALRSLDYFEFDSLFRNGKKASSSLHSTEAFKEGTIWDITAFKRFVLPKEPRIVKMLKEGCRVIDAGCGSGKWAIEMARIFPSSSFTGIDIDNEAIASARKIASELHIKNVTFHLADASNFRTEQKFDLAYLGEVLYLTDVRERILFMCKNVLKERGLIIICEGLLNKYSGMENMFMQVMRLDYLLQGGKMMFKDEVEMLLSKAGFKGSRYYHCGGGLWFTVAQLK